MTLYKWSQTAASDATADPSINWQEGQAPSTVNDSGRGMMAATAKYRDDIAGAIVTGGTATAYTVTSYQVFNSLVNMSGQMIAFTPNATNTNTIGNDVTLNVDGLGAKPIRSSPSVALPSGSLILGTPYVVTYNNTDGAFYLQGGLSNPYNIPLGAGMDYWGASSPNSAFAFPAGQAISRTTYATLFTLLSTTYGTGDGSTTFNLPDKRGRMSVGIDNMGGSASSRVTSLTASPDGQTLGAAAGGQQVTVAQANLPNVTLAVTGTVVVASTSTNVVTGTKNDAALQGGTTHFDVLASGTGGTSAISSSSANSGGSISLTAASINGNTTQTAMNNMPPAILCNYIMRVI